MVQAAALNWVWSIDGWIVLIAAVCAASAAILGNFLVLRRMSLIGDAISHAVLPGLAAAFLLSGQRQGWTLFLGAALIGVLTVFLTEFAKQVGRVEENASIGIVFTCLFAIGLLMISHAADSVDLDPGCVLYGALETSVLDTYASGVLTGVPRVLPNSLAVLCINIVFVGCLYRQLKVSTFDPQLARSQGIKVGILHYAFAACVAVTAVASFESVGNILVVAMFVVPPVAAWQLTDRLPIMIGLSIAIGITSAIAGHLSAIIVPGWFGVGATKTAGMIAVVAGILLVLATVFAPRKGILSRTTMSLRVAIQILSDDVLATIYRAERRHKQHFDFQRLKQHLTVPSWRLHLVIWGLKFRKQLTQDYGGYQLADAGRRQAQNIVRAHRLWENYLASEAGLPPELLHEGAELLEHFTDRGMRERLLQSMGSPALDPHGQPIPPEATDTEARQLKDNT